MKMFDNWKNLTVVIATMLLLGTIFFAITLPLYVIEMYNMTGYSFFLILGTFCILYSFIIFIVGALVGYYDFSDK